MFLTATVRTEEGESVGVLVLNPKTFSSGKEGYFGQGKLAIGGKRYQSQVQLVEIKEKAAAEAHE
ncbi:MAG: hypothetical protein M1531_04560 [Chloroflexi bacterium]|nr:hypothetical protein [Chloroflexota bacterium]